MTQPDELRTDRPLLWSTGRGVDVWALFQACVAGDLAGVKRLVERDPSLVRCQYAYRTPLYFAVRENRRDVVEYLLDRGGDPLSLAVDDGLIELARDRGYRELEHWLREVLARRFGSDTSGEPVAAAIRARDLARVRALLDADPGLLRAGDGRSNQPIHWAVMTRHLEMIDELLARGADLEARRFDGARPIHLTNGDYYYRGWRDVPASVSTTPNDVYLHLVSRGATVDLGMAAAKGNLARVRELLDQDPGSVNRVSEYGSYYLGCGAPLKNAAAAGHLEIVRFMLQRGADPNLPEEGIAPRGHALYSAVANGHYEIAKLLLEQGADPNAPVESSADPLSRAIHRKDQPMVDLLCRYGAARGVNLLAYDNDLRTAAAVFAANPALANDREALADAATPEFVELVLRHQPDLATRVTVVRGGAVAECLFRHGMDAGRPDWLGTPPLHEFAARGDVPNAGLYLRHGADLHARDEALRSSALGCAAKNGRLVMVEYLLRQGARLRLPDDPAWATPLAWAERRGHSRVVEVLRHQARFGRPPLRLTLTRFKTLVNDWVGAFADGNPEAIHRLHEEYGFRRVPDRDQIREQVRECVTEWAAGETLDSEVARRLVARLHGYDSWPDLEQQVGAALRDDASVRVWQAAERTVIEGDAVALEELLARHGELLLEGTAPPFSLQGPAPSYREDARVTILQAQQFETWEDFTAHRAARLAPGSVVRRFEEAVDALVLGDEIRLRQLLAADPSLVQARSARSHQATLLHYVGANGVEGFRQRTPPNAVELLRVLLRAGADVNAPSRLYGGSTTLGLVATSIHPWLAGVQSELLQTLLDHGARIDDPNAGGNGQSAVNGCLANGRREAAEFLAAHGAALDLEGAAGVGRLDVVRRWVDRRGQLLVGATDAQLYSGFQWACEYGRREIVAYLLDAGLDVARVHRGQTGLHWAAYAGDAELVELLLRRGASVEAEDECWRNPPLGWAVHGWFDPPPWTSLSGYPDVVARLVRAGAKVRAEWRAQLRPICDRRLLEALGEVGQSPDTLFGGTISPPP